MKLGHTTVIGVTLSAVCGNASAQNLVTNGGFEQASAGWTVTPASSGSWLVFFNNPNGSHSGNYFVQFLSFGGFDSIAQNLHTTPGASYSLDFWLRSFQDHFLVEWNGAQIMDVDAANAPQSWTEFKMNLTATGNVTPLEFRGRGSFFFDDVSVVPAPSGAFVVMAGTAAAFRRRRRN